MSEFGIKIKNYEAASIYGVNLGIRSSFDSKDAMLTNSLFLDFLIENGLNVYKGESTRDVICLGFKYGSKSYEDEVKKFKAKINALDKNDKLTAEEKEHKLYIYNKLIDEAGQNKDKFVPITFQDLRTKYYKEGVSITYNTYNRNGKIIDTETIHYKMLYRTPGKAKKGTVMFINEKLYDVAREFLYMGLTLPEKNSPIVEVGAYSSLITSTIVGRVQIKPEEILVLKDVVSTFNTDIVKVATDKDKHCYAEKVEGYDVSNELFDGQALIDSSIFPSWGDGYVLLRHHFTKCAAFNTHIQKFMREYYGDEYETATVKDMFGRDVRVKDIKLITTNNAIKWLKFDVDIEYWFDWVRKNDCQFGIVKTAHESKLGDVQRMSYQMINSLNIESMDNVMEKSIAYINRLKEDDEFFLDYLRANTNFSNDYEVLVALCEHNIDFVKSTYYRNRKKKIIEAYVLNFKSGRVIQNADNLTIVGSPYAMLLHSVGEDPLSDPTFRQEEGTIQVWTSRFNNGEYLAEFRNPFNSRNNLGYVHNVYHEYFDKYFNFGDLIIAVNMIGTDFQDRNNGSDQDSDSCYTTNQKDIVEHAKWCYENYPTIVNEIPKQKNIYDLSMESYAEIDNKLAAAQLAIGTSSNLAQICLTYTYNFKEQKYIDYVCILSVLAQCAIDNAKRSFDIDLTKEIDRIKKDANIDNNGLPSFWLITKKDKTAAKTDEERLERDKKNKNKIKEKLNTTLICPMNELYNQDLGYFKRYGRLMDMSEFFINHEQTEHHRKCKKVEELIEKYSFELHDFVMEHDGINWIDDDDVFVLRSDFNDLIKDIQSVYISKNYAGLMSWLINRAFCIGAGAKSKINETQSKTNKNKALLMKVLYSINPDVFLSCFVEKKVAND